MKTILSLIMTFKNEDGKNTNITLRNIKENLTDTQIKDVMDIIVSNELFITTGGLLTQVVAAKIVEKTSTEIELA